jgi:hypothetical protein
MRCNVPVGAFARQIGAKRVGSLFLGMSRTNAVRADDVVTYMPK